MRTLGLGDESRELAKRCRYLREPRTTRKVMCDAPDSIEDFNIFVGAET